MSTIMQIDIFPYIECCINLVGGEICSGIISRSLHTKFVHTVYNLNYIFWQPAFTKPFFSLSCFVDKMKVCFGSFFLGANVIR